MSLILHAFDTTEILRPSPFTTESGIRHPTIESAASPSFTLHHSALLSTDIKSIAWPNAHPTLTERGGWQDRRAGLLVETGAALSPPFEIAPYHAVNLEACLDPVGSGMAAMLDDCPRALGERMGRTLADLAAKSGPLLDTYGGNLDKKYNGLHYAGCIALLAALFRDRSAVDPSLYPAGDRIVSGLALYPALSDPSVTAIIAPSDISARGLLLRWLGHFSVPVPLHGSPRYLY